MKKRLCLWLMAFCLILLGQAGHRAYAQDPQTIEVGPHFGASSYVGELNAWRHLGQWKWKEFNQFNYDWGVLARYNPNTRWAFRFDYTRGKVRACDSIAAWRPEADLNFQSTFNDFAVVVEFNFLDYYTGHIQNTISPYIFGGVSMFFFDTKPFTRIAEVDEKSLIDFETECLLDEDGNLKQANKKNLSFSIPFGVGCKFSLSKHLGATVEWRMHYTFTDYLDDVSGVYPEDNEHVVVSNYDLTDPTGTFHAKQQRGNTQNNDWYGLLNLSLTWKFVIPNASACKMNIE
jgi:opacity protein-like surface antigen